VILEVDNVHDEHTQHEGANCKDTQLRMAFSAVDDTHCRDGEEYNVKHEVLHKVELQETITDEHS